MKPLFYQRYAGTILWLTLLVLPVAMLGAGKAVQNTRNRIIDWLPTNFDETQRMLWFNDKFGSDEILVISWPGCTLENSEIDRYVTALRAPQPLLTDDRSPSQRSETNGRPIFHEVVSGRSVLEEMTSASLNLLPNDARRRMQGWLVGADGNTTCIIARIQPNPDGSFSRIAAVQFAEAEAAKHAAELQLNLPDLKIAGPTADSAAVNRAGAENINWMRWCAVLFGLGLAWLGLRNGKQVAAVFATAMLATLLSLASVHFCGQHMDAILLPLPALVFVLTISGAVHLTHYYADAVRKHGLEGAAHRAVQAGGAPCALAAVTTMVGLASLAVSNVVPVRRFGLLSALGVGLGLGCLLLVWPAIAQRWRLPAGAHRANSRSDSTGRWWGPIFVFATRGRWAILALSIVALPMLTLGMGRLNTSVSLPSLLPADSKLLRSYDWFHKTIGPLVPVEVVLQFPNTKDADARSMFERAQQVEDLRARIEALEQSGGTFAATTFAPELPDSKGARQILQQRVIGQKLLTRRPTFVQRRLIATDDDIELWRISTRVSSVEGDYGPFLQLLNQVVDGFVLESRDDSLPESSEDLVTAKICGSVPLIQMAQRQLLLDLIRSLLVAVGLIAIAMMALLRSPAAGVISMIPNVFPSLLVLGIMGFRGKVVDIGTMMTASVALGIAVDDTLHFLVWFRRATAAGENRLSAIRTAFEKCAGAMLQTSIICGFGMLPFVYSSFGPVSRFAGGMMSLLAAALIGDLVVLPAILASPLGRFFAAAPLAAANENTTPIQTADDHLATQFKPV